MYQVNISSDKETIQRIIVLRYEVLRKPWGQSIQTVTDDLELSSTNAYIEIDNQLIACARLQDNGNSVGQIRFMAVSETQQGKGLGKLVIKALEKEAKKQGLLIIQLQARENAVEFYKACGYNIKEKTFLLWGLIQHYLMEKVV